MNAESNVKRYYNLFREMTNVIHSSIEVDEVLDLIVWKTAEALQAKAALLRILNLKNQQVELGTSHGLSATYISKSPASEENFLSDLYGDEKLIIIKDIANDPRVHYPQEVEREGIRMILDLPLNLHTQISGRLRLYFATQREFGADEIDFALSLASTCACAIDKARLIQEQKDQYSQLALHTEKLSALGRMAAGIAHEINNPLAGVLLYSSNLYKKAPAESPLKEGLGIIMRETQRCKFIIQELLEFARDKEPKKVMAAVNQIIVKSLRILENEFHLRHIKITSRLADDVKQGLLDENQLEQVFVNLLLNAIQAIDDDGVIVIQTRMDPSRQNAIITIEDNGCGIGEEHLNQIFEPFFSTKNHGSGLGLAVSYGIVRNHQGRLEVTSTPGKGTCFTITLPLYSSKDTP